MEWGEVGMEFRVVLQRDAETGDWAAWCPELPGCASAGLSEAAAIVNVREAIALYLEPSPMDLPDDAVVAQVAV